MKKLQGKSAYQLTANDWYKDDKHGTSTQAIMFLFDHSVDMSFLGIHFSSCPA